MLTTWLEAHREKSYGNFARSLIPTVKGDTVLGVRRPLLRKKAKELINEAKGHTFLKALPHTYYEEDVVHSYILEEIRDFTVAMEETEHFLPYIQNWAIADMAPPKVCKTHRAETLRYIKRWLLSHKPYVVRRAIVFLITLFIKEHFTLEQCQWVQAIPIHRFKEDDLYYVQMAIAWYYSMLIIYHFDEVIDFWKKAVLPIWIHNKSLQKACESVQCDKDRKEYLKTLKRKR